MPQFCEPLDSYLWFRRIEAIASGKLESVEASLRHASHLLQLTPIKLRDVYYLGICEEAFENLLEAGQWDEAAKHIVARPTGLFLASGADEPVKVVLSCPILKRTIEGVGETVATTILDAWTRCLLTIEAELGPVLFPSSNQTENKSQTGQGRRSSQH